MAELLQGDRFGLAKIQSACSAAQLFSENDACGQGDTSLHNRPLNVMGSL